MKEILNSGGAPSPNDYRTITHEYPTLARPYTRGGITYFPGDIEHQHKVGICTAISLVQNVQKALGKKYCPDFQYLLQKKYFDASWEEGSSIFSALRAAIKYGFLPRIDSPFQDESIRSLSYDKYIERLQSISDADFRMLLSKCEKKLTGYAKVDTSTPDNIAHAIDNSDAGILCLYSIGKEWWTSPTNGFSSWNPSDINPLRAPKVQVSGHAISAVSYDFTLATNGVLANTWGRDWNKNGCGDINFDGYKMIEAWIPYYGLVPNRITLPSKEDFNPTFSSCSLGSYSVAVQDLQTALMILGYLPLISTSEWGIYGKKTREAVFAFQLDKVPMNFLDKLYKGKYVGAKTISALSKLF